MDMKRMDMKSTHVTRTDMKRPRMATWRWTRGGSVAWLSACSATWLAVAFLCRAEISGAAEPSPAATPAQTAAQTAAPTAAPTWQRIEPGGATTCADGSPYHFFVRDGDPAHLTVFFQGGGACWSGATCDPEGHPSYRPSLAGTGDPPARGLFAADRDDNPFAADTVLFVPYCTGDVHLGDRVQRYRLPVGSRHPGRTLRIQHKGAVNAAAALDWLFRHAAVPARIFVAGSSAGAIAAPFHAVALAAWAPAARVAVLADGAGGYRRSATEVRPHRLWGAPAAVRQHPAFADLRDEDFDFEALTIAAAHAQPRLRFARFDTAEDDVQRHFLELAGGRPSSLLPLLAANARELRASIPTFRSFVAAGERHTILTRSALFELETAGTRLRDWIADLAEHRTVDDVLCDACAAAFGRGGDGDDTRTRTGTGTGTGTGTADPRSADEPPPPPETPSDSP